MPRLSPTPVPGDPDIYQLKNIAVGQPCDTRTIDQNKAEVAAASVRAANPEIKLHVSST